MNGKWMHRITVLAALATFVVAFDASAQYGRTKTKADASQGATASQTLGVDSKVSIDYHRPGVKGREIWGTNLAKNGTPAWVNALVSSS